MPNSVLCVAAPSPQADVGAQLRRWRRLRRLTQLELALDSGVSTRHISFVENGRSRPGREMLLRVSRCLDLPPRERNQMLLAAGHAPALAERRLDDPELESVRSAIEMTLAAHRPNPAIAVDRHWNIIGANDGVLALARTLDIDPALAEPPVNAIRATFHPRGLAPLIVDIETWRAFFRERLSRQLASSGDPELAALLEELDGYPSAPDSDDAETPAPGSLPGPLRMRTPDGRELVFLSMFASFDAPFEVTTSELAIELLFPFDRATAEALTELSA